MKRSFEEYSDEELEDKVLDILYKLKTKKQNKQETILESIKLISEDNPIYCDKDIDKLNDYIADVEDYITFAEKEDKIEVLNKIKIKNL